MPGIRSDQSVRHLVRIARRAGLHAAASQLSIRAVTMKGDRPAVDGDARNARARRRGRLAIGAGALSQGRGMPRALSARRRGIPGIAQAARIEPGDDAAGKPAASRVEDQDFARTVCRSVPQRALHTGRISAGAKAHSSTGERRRSRYRRDGAGPAAGPLAAIDWLRGSFLSVTCTEDVPVSFEGCGRDGRGNVRRQLTASSNSAPRARNGGAGTVSSAHRQPTKSAIPTLLLSANSIRSRRRQARKKSSRGLSKGRHVVIRNNGHPIGNAEACIGRMISQFLDAGSADDRRCNAAPPTILLRPVSCISGKDQ